MLESRSFWQFPAWKFNEFSTTQILREINFGNKNGTHGSYRILLLRCLFRFYVKLILENLEVEIGALNFDDLVKLSPTKMQKFKASECVKMVHRFCKSRIPRIHFTQKLSDRKIMKFPHCELATLQCISILYLWDTLLLALLLVHSVEIT